MEGLIPVINKLQERIQIEINKFLELMADNSLCA